MSRLVKKDNAGPYDPASGSPFLPQKRRKGLVKAFNME
jgi:hypothetical protein